MKTVDQVYVQSKLTQSEFSKVLDRQVVIEDSQIVSFEDTMNGLSGEIQNLPPEEILEIQTENSRLVEEGIMKGYEIQLHDSILLKEDRIENTELFTILAKRLYPRTESVQIGMGGASIEFESDNDSDTDSSDSSNVAVVTVTVDEDEIDPIFEEIDAEASAAADEYAPISMEENETIPYLPDGMVELAKEAAANANGLQAGLVAFSYNPLAEVIDDTIELLLYYTANNYANLNVALAGINADPLIATEYKTFQDSVAGNDGLSGSVAQLDIFKDHTDRLSGLVLEVNSPNAEEDDNTTVDNLTVLDVANGTPQVLFSFDARKFRSAKYTIQASSDQTNRGHQVSDIILIHDNHHAFTKEIKSVYTEDPFVAYTTRFANNRVEVLANTTVANSNFVVYGTRLKIAKDSESHPEMSQQAIIKMHEDLSVFLDEGVDYVSAMSGSVIKPYLVANLARDFRDFLVNLAAPVFISMSTGSKKSALNAAAVVMNTRRNEIQESIELDWTNFQSYRKLQEALDIAYNLTMSYTDGAGNVIPRATLNNRAIVAIEASIESVAETEETEE